jgi:thioesterase domain-containing protein
MAREYVDALLKQQKDGPYFLAGYSLGVCIALEMACVLRSLGKEVARVFFIDLRLGEREPMDSEFVSLLFLFQNSFRMELFHEYKSLDDNQKVDFLLEYSYREGRFPPSLERERARRMVAVYYANGKASASYIPEILEKVKGMPVTYFFSTLPPAFAEKGGSKYAELFAKENERKRATPNAYFVEGSSHFNILEMPFAKQLAEHIATEIKNVQESYGIK